MKSVLLLILATCGCSSLGSTLEELSQTDASEAQVEVVVKKTAPVTEQDSIITETPWHMVFGSDPNIIVRQQEYVGFLAGGHIYYFANLEPDTLVIQAFVEDQTEPAMLFRGFVERGFFIVQMGQNRFPPEAGAVHFTLGGETKIPKVIFPPGGPPGVR